jgi:hypothetical protein
MAEFLVHLIKINVSEWSFECQKNKQKSCFLAEFMGYHEILQESRSCAQTGFKLLLVFLENKDLTV